MYREGLQYTHTLSCVICNYLVQVVQILISVISFIVFSYTVYMFTISSSFSSEMLWAFKVWQMQLLEDILEHGNLHREVGDAIQSYCSAWAPIGRYGDGRRKADDRYWSTRFGTNRFATATQPYSNLPKCFFWGQCFDSNHMYTVSRKWPLVEQKI